MLLVEKIRQQVEAAVEELIEAAEPKPGQVFVVGCSTSEVLGNKIGTAGSLEAAKEIFDACEKLLPHMAYISRYSAVNTLTAHW